MYIVIYVHVVKAELSWAPFAALRSATKTSFGQVYIYMYI